MLPEVPIHSIHSLLCTTAKHTQKYKRTTQFGRAMVNELHSKLVVVTGASSGIGLACAQLFAEESATVVLVDVTMPGEHVFDKLNGQGHTFLHCDVSNAASVQSMSKQCMQLFGTCPNALVHCAGILGASLDGILGCTEQIFDRVIEVNLKGTYLLNRCFALLMKEHSVSGSIVNVSSIAQNGSSKVPAYAASKAGQVGFTKSLSKELAPYSIRCNTVHPGSIDTPFALNSGIPTEQLNNPELRPSVPLGRLGTAKDVAQVCLFLASDRSSYVTGSEYEVHGGVETNN